VGVQKANPREHISSVSDAEQKYYEELLSNMSDDDKSISSKETIDL
jgi:hypothetical protein